METASVNWQRWQQFFEHRRNKKLPELEAPESYSDVPASVARSLAIFQLGESGGGTICQQARNSRIKAVDSNYANAMESFVNEEHRHAEVLAICVRNLGGTFCFAGFGRDDDRNQARVIEQCGIAVGGPGGLSG